MTSHRIPVVCTLSETSADRQLSEWADLVAAAERVDEVEHGVRIVVPETHVSVARDLVEREAQCCGFMSFASTENPLGGIDLTITSADPAGVSVVHLLAGRTAK